MRLRPPLRMSVTRRGEKEQRLGEFVGDYLAEAQQARSQPGAEILLVARSVESPVVKAIAAQAAEIVAAGYSVRDDRRANRCRRDAAGLGALRRR